MPRPVGKLVVFPHIRVPPAVEIESARVLDNFNIDPMRRAAMERLGRVLHGIDDAVCPGLDCAMHSRAWEKRARRAEQARRREDGQRRCR